MDPLKRAITNDRLLAVLKAWELLRILHTELPAQAVTIFLYVGSHNPCHKLAIEEDQGLTTASCSRMIDVLSEQNYRLKKPGLGLIEKYLDVSNRRRYLLRLTPKGKALLIHLQNLIDDH